MAASQAPGLQKDSGSAMNSHNVDNRSVSQVVDYLTYLDSDEHRLLLQNFIPHLYGNIILDVGCGTGTFFEEITKANYPVQKLVGIEVSQILSDKAQKKQIPHAEIICTSIDTYPLPSNAFDTITLISVFHELFSYNTREKLIEILTTLYHSLANGGILLIYDGFKYEDKLAYLEIKSKKRKELFEKYLAESGYKDAFVSVGKRIICPVSIALDFIHKSSYLENWEHELPENYYPLSLFTYPLLLEAIGFTVITTIRFPELDGIEELNREIRLYDYTSKNLLNIYCNCLIVSKKCATAKE